MVNAVHSLAAGRRKEEDTAAVRLANVIIVSGEQTPAKKSYEVIKMVVHEGFNPRIRDNDIALLLTSEPIQFNEDVQPVCYPADPGMQIGKMKNCWASGIGENEYSFDAPAVPKIWMYPENTCRYQTARNMLCRGSDVQSFCKGDSGGPLACQNRNKTWIVFGIRTVSLSCNKAAIFASTVKYINWIKEKTAQEGKPFIPQVSLTPESENKPGQGRGKIQKTTLKVLYEVINTPGEETPNMAVVANEPYEEIGPFHHLSITEPNVVKEDVRDSTLTENPVLTRSNYVGKLGLQESTVAESAFKEPTPVPRASKVEEEPPEEEFNKNTNLKPGARRTGTRKVKKKKIRDKNSRTKKVTSSESKKKTANSKTQATATERPDGALGLPAAMDIPEKIVEQPEPEPATSTAVRPPIISAQEEPKAFRKSRKLEGKRPRQLARNIGLESAEGQKTENSETLTNSELLFAFGVAMFFLLFMCFLLSILGFAFLGGF
ncbi:uncharacterized protein LOC144762682 [Lissotriton helveticus]